MAVTRRSVEGIRGGSSAAPREALPLGQTEQPREHAERRRAGRDRDRERGHDRLRDARGHVGGRRTRGQTSQQHRQQHGEVEVVPEPVRSDPPTRTTRNDPNANRAIVSVFETRRARSFTSSSALVTCSSTSSVSHRSSIGASDHARHSPQIDHRRPRSGSYATPSPWTVRSRTVDRVRGARQERQWSNMVPRCRARGRATTPADLAPIHPMGKSCRPASIGAERRALTWRPGTGP